MTIKLCMFTWGAGRDEVEVLFDGAAGVHVHLRHVQVSLDQRQQAWEVVL